MNSELVYMQKQLSSVWPEWRITRKLGKGTYGSVYEILRDDLGTGYRCALKVLQMEDEDAEDSCAGLLRSAEEDRTVRIGHTVYGTDSGRLDESGGTPLNTGHGYSDAEDGSGTGITEQGFREVPGTRDSGLSQAYDQTGYRSDRSAPQDGEDALEDFVRSISNEIDLMMKLKGDPHIVAIEDYAVLRKKGQRTILIRMELLESLDVRLKWSGGMALGEILRMGMDICSALDSCEKCSILHRDIKTSNIYYSERAGYKLGDFGISRTMDSIHERMSMTSAGTIQYMAPEIYLGKRYNHTADIYSLGMVLYLLMNEGIPPFCDTGNGSRGQSSDYGPGSTASPNDGSLIPVYGARRPAHAEIHSANMRRLRGEPLPPPSRADRNLASILCMACDPDPDRRFQSAAAFSSALQAYQDGAAPSSGGSPFSISISNGENASASGSRSFSMTSQSETRGSSSGGRQIPGTPVHPPGNKFPVPALIGAAAGILILLAVFFLFNRNGNQQDTSGKSGHTPIATGDNGTGQNDADSGSAQHDPDNNESADPSSSVSYLVMYMDSDGSPVLDNDSGTGEAGEEIEVTAPELEGYTLDNDRQTLVLSDNAQDNTVVFIYKEVPTSREEPVQEESEQEESSESEPAIVYNTEGHLRILNKKYTERAEFDILAARFARESGIDTSVESPKTGKYSSTLAENLTGSRSDPTIFILSGTRDFEKYGSQCLDLTDCAAAKELLSEDYALHGTNGRTYGLACIVESYGLLVNTDLLEKAGYSISDIQSFRDLKRITEDITSRKKSLGFSAFTSPSIGPSAHGYYRYAEHAPAVPLYYELRDNDFNTGMTLHGDYMGYFKDYIDLCLNNSCVSPKQATSRTLEDAQQEFIQQKAVFHQDGSWDYRMLKDSMQNNLDVLPLYMGIPGEEDHGQCSTTSYFWCVNKYASADDIEAALQFLQWLVTSDDGRQTMASDMDFLIPYKGASAPDNLFLRKLLEEEEEGRPPVIQYYKNGNYDSWINAINNALEAYANGTGSWGAVTEGFKKLW